MAKPKKNTVPIVVAPPPPPKPLDPYAEGMLAALKIVGQTRADLEKPLRHADVGAGYVALNALTHWGQTITSEAETRVLRHLMERVDAQLAQDTKEGT